METPRNTSANFYRGWIKLRKIFWLGIMTAYLALTVKLVKGIVLPALRPLAGDTADAAFYAEAYGPVRALLPEMFLSLLVGFIGCAWGFRNAWRDR